MAEVSRLRLSEVIARCTSDAEITGIAVDSRVVKTGYLFAALPGTSADGRAFIPQAIAAGAAAILVPEGTHADPAWGNIPIIERKDIRSALGHAADKFYAPKPEHLLAVTGTNGKTSTVHFLRQILGAAGKAAASIGTLGIVDAASKEGLGEGNLTTPDVITLHQELARLKSAGVDYVAMEASSHGLDQGRLAGVKVEVAGFTNLTRDHLDYHATMEDYKQAKYRLFTDILQKGGIAVINADIPEVEELAALCAARHLEVVTYGHNGKQVKLRGIKPTLTGQAITMDVNYQPYQLTLALMGGFQVSNLLCAIGLAMATGLTADETIAAAAHVTPVPGRMQVVATHPNGAPILVDYAHTPDALEKLLHAVKNHVEGRLHLVFGCGGDRDKGKRPVMGQIAAKLADKVIVTDDNPRTEDAATIRQEVMKGCPYAQEIGDRVEAIRQAIEALSEGDVLVIAGKGHEDYQIIGTEKRPFSDVEVAREMVAGSR